MPTQPPWYTMEEAIERFVSDPLRSQLLYMIADNKELFYAALGSSNNHQNWIGGWYDHTSEVCTRIKIYYDLESLLRPLPFSLEDAMVAGVAHDLEKPKKYKVLPDGRVEYVLGYKTKESDNDAREAQLALYGIALNDQQRNGMLYAEGEFDYTNKERRMWPIGALVHMADVASARLAPWYPLAKDDPWQGARRIAEVAV